MRNGMKVLVIAVCLLIVAMPYVLAEEKQMEKGEMGMKGMCGEGMCMMGEREGTGMMCMCGGMGMENKMDFDKMFNSKISFILRNSKDLGLSDDQMMKIKELKCKIEKSMIMRKAEMEVTGIDIMQAFGKDDIDTVAIGKLIDKKYESKKMESKDLVDAYANLNVILTKEQQKTLKDIRSNHMMDRKQTEKGSKEKESEENESEENESK